jgi:small subunit ribosomal protein S4
MHGKNSSGKKSDYAKQLREKQKTKRIFGVSEKQIQKYYKKATSSPLESGQELLRQLEQRFDNVVFRAGFATTRRQARQFVTHGLLTLNGKRIMVPSVQVEEGDVFAVKEKNKSITFFQAFAKRKLNTPSWLKVDQVAMSGQVLAKATKEHLEASVDPAMIIEFYSR